ncbi:hypothetical protein [Flavobacterium cellulosilyticum]|uniref:Adenylosuccinate synthetase n=1 Tax=Flavobacterium cellulosilyticum TaxID=2541731 RepID=A0A4R5CE46_9FLAO|nr:hypothetical protein [Flavobacterium cellulosilyticum]TDD96523.1 hypothetical protein E0F76_10960 [Flavobacterium cellulosilyticum]
MFKKVESQKAKVQRKNIFFVLCFLLLQFSANAQCAMCRAALSGESNLAQAQAVNDGIIYLMVVPYLLVGVIGYAVYRMRKNKK